MKEPIFATVDRYALIGGCLFGLGHWCLHFICALSAGMSGPSAVWTIVGILSFPVGSLSHPYGPGILNSAVWGMVAFALYYVGRRMIW
jgi:uncharacterized membrane protein YedE/YeeE